MKSAGGGNGNYRLSSHLLFIIPDGSLLLCWSSEDTKNTDSQQKLFDELTIGGDFPKLPFQIDALNTSFKGKTVTFNGRHLLYTKKGNKFYEWGIYTSAKEINPEYLQLLNYQLVYSSNEQAKEGAFSIGISPDFQIRDKEDFDEIFSGAIKELSEDGKMPENITYEKVMDLSEQISKKHK